MKKTEENKTGWVYCWVNLTNGKRRVGHTVNLDSRIKRHIREAKNPKYPLQKAIRKYSLQKFVVESWQVPVDKMCQYETLLKKKYNTTNPDFGYDLIMDEEDTSGGNNPMFNKHHSEEAIKLISDKAIKRLSNKENHPMFGRKGENSPMFGRTGDNHPMFGKHHSEEARKLISEKKKGDKNNFFGKHHSEEAIKLISDKAIKRLSNKENHPMFDKHHSEETIKVMSERRKQYWANKKTRGLI